MVSVLCYSARVPTACPFAFMTDSLTNTRRVARNADRWLPRWARADPHASPLIRTPGGGFGIAAGEPHPC